MLLFKTFMTKYRSFHPKIQEKLCLLIYVCICSLCLEQPAMARETIPSPVGILLADPAGHVIYEDNADLAFIPASTLKVLTSLTALDLLGPGFHFKTDFFLDNDGNLKIKGWGDPMLTSRKSRTWPKIWERSSRQKRSLDSMVWWWMPPPLKRTSSFPEPPKPLIPMMQLWVRFVRISTQYLLKPGTAKKKTGKSPKKNAENSHKTFKTPTEYGSAQSRKPP